MVRLLLLLLATLVVMFVIRGLRLPEPPRAQEGRGRTKMTRHEALLVLGLAEGASKQEIVQAYRQLVRKVHPDTPGGSAYLTAQLNQARDVLLGSP